jgi:hypothetical protein
MATMHTPPSQPQSHSFARPSWTCRDCQQPWPCPQRRTLLLAEAHTESPVAVSLFLAGCLFDALRDQPTGDAGTFYARFLGWLRTARVHQAPHADAALMSPINPRQVPRPSSDLAHVRRNP